jgi:hypothetical protein
VGLWDLGGSVGPTAPTVDTPRALNASAVMPAMKEAPRRVEWRAERVRWARAKKTLPIRLRLDIGEVLSVVSIRRPIDTPITAVTTVQIPQPYRSDARLQASPVQSTSIRMKRPLFYLADVPAVWRVPTMSCAAPKVSEWRCTPLNPAARSRSNMTSGAGR